MKERESQIQLQEAEIKYGLEQLQLRLTGQQGIQLNPSQSSSSMSVPQYQMQIPSGEQSYGEVAAIGRVKRLSVGGKSSASAPAPQYGMTGGQSSSSMSVPQLQIQAPPQQFALMDLIPEEQLPEEIKAEAEAAITSGVESYQYPIVKPNPKELDEGEFKQQSKAEWKGEKIAVLRRQF